MVRLPSFSPELFRLEWSSAGRPLAEVAGAGGDVDLVAADDPAPVGTLQTFVDADGALRGRVSLRAGAELRVIFPAHAEVRVIPAGGAGRRSAAEDGTAGAAGLAAGRPTAVPVVADLTHAPVGSPPAGPSAAVRLPHFLRFAISGVTAPELTALPGPAHSATVAVAIAVALGGGEYFLELRAADTADQAAEPRPLNRRTHFTARNAAAAATSTTPATPSAATPPPGGAPSTRA